MKLIILLLLIATNTFADVRVNVTTSDGKISCGDGCPFKTQMEADIWKSENISNNSWGMPGTYTISEVDITQDVLDAKTERTNENIEIARLKTAIKNLPAGDLKKAIILLFKKRFGK